jgi:NgoFVII restriction endonuclease
MKLFLHSPAQQVALTKVYDYAFSDAIELFVVSAYLTEWNETLRLGPKLKTFRLIIGKDFGITRKDACFKVLKWLPPSRKAQFLVADNIQGFHPKAIFWQSSNGSTHALVGSSNLTKAAFERNYEANALAEISQEDYRNAKVWIKEIENHSVVVSEDWLARYVESKVSSPSKSTAPGKPLEPTIRLILEEPPDSRELLTARRRQLSKYKESQASLIELFRKCAQGQVSSESFFKLLPTIWDMSFGNRLQGKGWERRGKAADFQEVSNSFLKILDTKEPDQDDVVGSELDKLAELENPARRAFLSEMLCLAFPSRYPVLNKPVSDYLKAMKFRSPIGATEGARYIDLAKKLRSFLVQNPNFPAKTLAELDTLIWRIYGKNPKEAA